MHRGPVTQQGVHGSEAANVADCDRPFRRLGDADNHFSWRCIDGSDMRMISFSLTRWRWRCLDSSVMRIISGTTAQHVGTTHALNLAETLGEGDGMGGSKGAKRMDVAVDEGVKVANQ